MTKKLLSGLAAGLILYGVASVSLATPIELVVNGEFENPDFTGSWTHVLNDTVDGWSNSSGQMEFWNQGEIRSPSVGSDGLDTGQHHEVSWNGDNEFTIQDFGILSDGLIGLASMHGREQRMG